MVSKSMERLNPQNSQAQLWLGQKKRWNMLSSQVPQVNHFRPRSSRPHCSLLWCVLSMSCGSKKNKGLFTWRWETPCRWGNPLQNERIYEVHIMIWTVKFKNWFRDAQRAYRVKVHAGSLENKRRSSLNQLPKCIYNSIYAPITWTSSFIT